MKKKKGFEIKGILDWIILAGLVLVAVILPLYHREGFTMIGDRKYTLFLVVSITLALTLCLQGIGSLVRGEYEFTSLERIAMLYGVVVMLSAYKSRYPQTALWGYEDWHMGLVSQLLFLTIFFAAIRTKRIQERILPWMLRSAMVVFLLGILNRFGIDPLGMFDGLEYWNMTHLISTVGNSNWYSGYMTLLFSIGYVLYLQKERKIELLFFIIIGFATVLTHGSESGLLTCGILLFLSLLYAALSKDVRLLGRIQKSLVLFGGIGLGLSLISVAFPEDRNFAEDAVTQQLLNPWIWLVLLFVFVCFLMLLRVFREGKKGFVVSLTILLAASLSILVILCNLRLLLEEWGSGRIELWRISWEAYCEMPLLNQLIGVGPDCYAHYMYAVYPEQMGSVLNGYWGEAVIANAHNEWINRLICTGALGYVAYVGLVIGAIILFLRKRNQNQYLLPLAAGLVMIMIHQTASFQHVMVTPFIFLVMGMGGNLIENEKE